MGGKEKDGRLRTWKDCDGDGRSVSKWKLSLEIDRARRDRKNGVHAEECLPPSSMQELCS